MREREREKRTAYVRDRWQGCNIEEEENEMTEKNKVHTTEEEIGERKTK